MKKKDLERNLKRYGWWLKRDGSNHDIWTNGFESTSIPRHNSIREQLAQKIIKKAQMSFEKGVHYDNSRGYVEMHE